MVKIKKPEELARVLIDEQLTRAGWRVCDRNDIDLINHQGNAVREVIMQTGHGRCDYLLYVDKKIVGVIEAKPVGTPLAGNQTVGLAQESAAKGDSPVA